jgi:hypothetical protein
MKAYRLLSSFTEKGEAVRIGYFGHAGVAAASLHAETLRGAAVVPGTQSITKQTWTSGEIGCEGLALALMPSARPLL